MSSGGHDGLRIKRFSLADFRSYESFVLDDVGDLTVFVGNNGVGKTNILEALQLMTSAESFRHPQVSHLIREGRQRSLVCVEASDGNRLLTTELLLEPGKKRYSVNGKSKGIADIRGVLPAVVFTPDDLQLAKKSSSVKRDALDSLGMQLTKNYYIVRRDYEKTVRYKNRLLKEEASRALIESINETLITCGSQLFCYRATLFNRLLPLVSANYDSIAEGSRDSRVSAGQAAGDNGDAASVQADALDEGSRSKRGAEVFSAEYLPSWEYVEQGMEGRTELAASPDRQQVKERLSQALQLHYEEERIRRRSVIGPHNDKITFLLSGRDASSFASQGQQRSIVLAWKLAEVELTKGSLGTSPVLLLDDVMSELDETRREMLVRFVTDDIQTFITATDLSGFNESLLDRARVIELPPRRTGFA